MFLIFKVYRFIINKNFGLSESLRILILVLAVHIIGIIFVTLFSVIINTSSSFILHREGYNGIKICKLIPISYKKQVLIKMAVPFMASFIASLVSVALLVSFNELSILNGVFAFFIALVLQILMETLQLQREASWLLPTKLSHRRFRIHRAS